MPLAKYNDTIKTFAPDRADQRGMGIAMCIARN
jgi:hypothetical protein